VNLGIKTLKDLGQVRHAISVFGFISEMSRRMGKNNPFHQSIQQMNSDKTLDENLAVA